MANFDPNQWYHIYYNQDKGTAMMGSSLYNRTTQSGTTFFQTADTSQPVQQWQFFRIDSEYYALRTRDSGNEGFLATKYSREEDTPGKTVPHMIRGNVSDDSAYWKVSPWDDGTFYLSNKANTTEWHLIRKDNSLAAMTSNITGDKPFQHFSFESISAINNEQFSTVELPTATVTSVPTSSSSSSPGNPSTTGTSRTESTSSPQSPVGQSEGGLSSGAKAGIGAGVGLAVLIALVVGGLFLWRRRRRSQAEYIQPMHASHQYSDQYTAEIAAAPTHELPHNGAVKYEAYGTPQAELHHESRPAELPGAIPPYKGR